jgi:hypothetical protein
MEPLPGRPADPDGAEHVHAEFIEVGEFEQGSAFSRWALARYLVGRAVGESVGRSLLVLGLLAVGLAVVATWVLHSQLLAALLVLLAVALLLLGAAVRALLRRFTAVRAYAPIEDRLRGLVRDTRRDVLRELRRIGLPGRALTLPLLAVRLLGRRRRETTTRLRAFEVERAVPRSRIDELHSELRRAVGR